MVIKLSKLEISVLLLHMNITRKNVKKGFKNKYSSKERKELMQQYDSITILLGISFEKLQEGEIVDLTLSEEEINLLDSFLTWYVTEIEATFETAGKKITGEDKEQIDILHSINDQIKRDKLNYV